MYHLWRQNCYFWNTKITQINWLNYVFWINKIYESNRWKKRILLFCWMHSLCKLKGMNALDIFGSRWYPLHRSIRSLEIVLSAIWLRSMMVIRIRVTMNPQRIVKSKFSEIFGHKVVSSADLASCSSYILLAISQIPIIFGQFIQNVAVRNLMNRIIIYFTFIYCDFDIIGWFELVIPSQRVQNESRNIFFASWTLVWNCSWISVVVWPCHFWFDWK